MASGPLQGVDALLSTVQMPPGIPVATVGIGPAGATNAALLAASMLALGDDELSERLKSERDNMAQAVMEKDRQLQQRT
jgi:phosphoribosylaminoimidazole carboxylase PurE protein